MKTLCFGVCIAALVTQVVACGGGSGSGADPAGADSSLVNDSTPPAEAGDETATEGGSCSTDTQCASLLTSVTPTPTGCAEAFCNKASGACGLRPIDADGDGFRTATCDVPGFAGFTKGTDCDDADKNFFPGKSRTCSALPDGTPISWPSGTPVGECKYGMEACGPDGKTGACLNAIAPTKTPNCSSDKDNTCVGKADSVLCGCKLGDVRDCYDGAAGTKGVGPCKGGSQTCIASPTDPTATVWNTCLGEVVPASKDACSPGDDSNCNGKSNEGCSCTADVPNDTLNCKGDCTSGKHVCNTATGTWTGCVGTVNYSVNAGPCGGCNYCPGSSCTPPALITATGDCGNCTYCPGKTACVPPGKTDCIAGGGCSGGLWCGPGTTCVGPVTKGCGSCPAVACSSTCAVHCPASMPDRGAFCFNVSYLRNSFGVTTPLGSLGSNTMPAIPAGASAYGTPTLIVSGSQSTTDHCGNSASSVPLTITCSATGGKIYYNEANFAAGDVLSMPCPAGSVVTADHTANGTTCCFGGCARSFNVNLVSNVNTCGTTS